MSTDSNERTLSPAVVKELEIQFLRINSPTAARRLWDRLRDWDRRQLGDSLPDAYRAGGTVGMWMALRGVSQARAIVDVAHKLGFLDQESHQWLLQEIDEAYEDPHETRQAAITSGALVLIEHPHTAYWEGEEIELNWERNAALWQLLWGLSVLAKRRRPLDCFDLGEFTTSQATADRKCRLVNHDTFPVSLQTLIETQGQGTYRLQLPPERIRIFAIEQDDRLREITG